MLKTVDSVVVVLVVAAALLAFVVLYNLTNINITERDVYKRQVINMYPQEPGKGYEFENKIVGGVVPKEYIPSIDKGIQEAVSYTHLRTPPSFLSTSW